MRGPAQRREVASGGYFGPPKDGAVEIGYSVVEAERGAGYASELVAALSARALALPGVAAVESEAADSNAASLRVLEKCGFRPCGPGREPGSRRYRLAAA